MKNYIFLLLIAFLLSSCFKHFYVVVSEKDVDILVDGNSLGKGEVRVKVYKDECTKVKVEKQGYLTENRTYCFDQVRNYKDQFIEMQKDDSYDASIKSDLANKDFTLIVSSKYKEEQAWKLIGQIAGDYFDELEKISPETGYISSSWTIKSFKQNTVRTKLIVRQSNTTPLTYKIKILSEHSNQSNISAKNDELFMQWDRVLRRYEGMISEFQIRLSNK